MKTLGVLVCVSAVLGAIALWLYLLTSGIVMTVEEATASPIDGSRLAWGIVRAVLAEVSGGLVAFFGVLLGIGIFHLGRN